jgi:hypothetical protein
MPHLRRLNRMRYNSRKHGREGSFPELTDGIAFPGSLAVVASRRRQKIATYFASTGRSVGCALLPYRNGFRMVMPLSFCL